MNPARKRAGFFNDIMKYKLTSAYRKLLADTATPVSIYLKLRDVFPNSLLLESSDYHSRENSMSYICCEPIAGMALQNGTMTNQYPDGTQQEFTPGTFDVVTHIEAFLESFETTAAPLKITSNGLFGYFSHEIVEHFETITLKKEEDRRGIPEMQYFVYRYIIAVDHFKNELYIFENQLENDPQPSGLERIQYLIQNKNFPEYHFNLNGEESSNLKDEEFIGIVEKMKQHILRGDVFQIVPSRSFSQPFQGDEFNVYRALRSINPSPYLFYFDYGNFKIFGSSPEAQITIKNRIATIYPIAGTFKRTGDDEKDAQ